MNHHSTTLGGAVCGSDQEKKTDSSVAIVGTHVHSSELTMKSSKSNHSTDSGLVEGNSETTDEGKNELCPGFKDADAFVKVSKVAGQSF